MRVIEYAAVLAQAVADGLRCVYPNSGAFAPAGPHEIIGWIGPADASIRADLPATIVQIQPPYAENLAARFAAAFEQQTGGEAWLLPKSHWAYELAHAHQDWLVERLDAMGVDAAALATHTDAPALAFDRSEARPLMELMTLLLNRLTTSDYTLLLPGRPAVVTLHHHQQLWWQTATIAL